MATYSLSGINTNNCYKMKNAVITYKNYLKNRTDISATNAQIHAAVKGTQVEGQIKILAQTIETKIKALYSELDAFSRALDSVVAAYKKQDSSATAVSDVTGSIKS